MGVALAAVTDNCDLLGLNSSKIRILVVVDVECHVRFSLPWLLAQRRGVSVACCKHSKIGAPAVYSDCSVPPVGGIETVRPSLSANQGVLVGHQMKPGRSKGGLEGPLSSPSIACRAR